MSLTLRRRNVTAATVVEKKEEKKGEKSKIDVSFPLDLAVQFIQLYFPSITAKEIEAVVREEKPLPFKNKLKRSINIKVPSIGQTLTLKEGDEWPKDDKKYDTIVFYLYLHHINRDNVWAEADKRLNDGGRVVIVEYDTADHPYFLSLLKECVGPYNFINPQIINIEASKYNFINAFSITQLRKRSNGLVYTNVFTKQKVFGDGKITWSSSSVSTLDNNNWLNEMLKQIHAIGGKEWTEKSRIPWWIKAMTDNKEAEPLEFMGRSLLSIISTDYAVKNFPLLDESQYTDLRKRMTSNNTMSLFANRLGLTNIVRRKELGIDNGYSSKLFPRFMGALYLSSPKETKGIDICYNFLYSLYDKEKIDESWYAANPVTQMTQLFQVLGEHEKVFNILEDNRSCTITFTPRGRNIVNKYASGINTRDISYQSSNKEEARLKAYNELFDRFNRRGLNLIWARKHRREDLLNKTNLKGFYEGVWVETVNKNKSILGGKEVNIIQLLGTYKDTEEIISSVIYTEGNKNKALSYLYNSALNVATLKKKK
jgi:hypothetical protein